jgi:hypothetical protein
MAEWTVRVNIYYSKPGAPPNGTLVAYHTFTVSFDCSCCTEREKQRAEPSEVDIERFNSSIRNVRVTKSFASTLGFGEAMLAPDPDRFTGTASEVQVRAANCPEGQGIIVWITASGAFNTNENPPPFLWENYGATGAWRICCCCDPFTCKTSYTVQNHRYPKGGGSGGLTVHAVAEENFSCDDELQSKDYVLTMA